MSTENFSLSFSEALEKAGAGEKPAVDWLVPLLTCSREDESRLFGAADKVREACVGKAVHLRGLIEFSNHCRKNCAYCGLRRDNLEVERYRLEIDALVQTALEAKSLGYHSVVLQSGEDPWYTPERLAEAIREIKAKTELAITLSVGERDENTYRLWREAGADRFLLRIETTDEELFARLHPDDDLSERMDCLRSLKKLDYQLGSGVMVGLPGQTPEMLAKDIIWLKELGAEMIGVGPFISHPDTPLSGEKGGTVEQTLRLVAVLRLVFPYAHLPATTALGSLDDRGREKALETGANVMMPNVTPIDNRAKYQIYPGKICLADDARHCRGCIEGRIKSIGRTMGTDRGDVHRK
ncbi:MAG TPA: [FeFe] hydrogenase H-cluster radical SAM maturase HydE [Cyanobacteria bacterium UBA8530]|nr:[FeFe] hydrogenase H-cluster radical SAM maturase HydE [Cyanobacteria bacterium UBA8530]